MFNVVLPITTERRIYSDNATWLDIDQSGTREICIVNPATGDGLIYRRDRKKQKEVLKEFRELSRLIRSDYDRVADEWRARWPELTNEPFWREYLGL